MNTKAQIFVLMLSLTLSCKSNPDYYHLPTFSSNKAINAVIEIPAGTNKKYEYNLKTQKFEIDQKNGKDRVIAFLPYSGNYGFIPSTYSNPKSGGDGDAIDVLLISESLPTGTVIEIIPIAMLKLIDDGELDYKIIAVPYKKKDRVIVCTTYKEFEESYSSIKSIIETWFLNYNKDDLTRVDSWANEIEALDEINSNLL